MAFARLIDNTNIQIRQEWNKLFGIQEKEESSPLPEVRVPRKENKLSLCDVFKDVVAIVRERRELSPLHRFLKALPVVPRWEAQYALQYPDGQTLMTLGGEYCYFETLGRALTVQKELRNKYGMETDVAYGPISTRGECGWKIGTCPKKNKRKKR
jgi:hypothetical protein